MSCKCHIRDLRVLSQNAGGCEMCNCRAEVLKDEQLARNGQSKRLYNRNWVAFALTI